MAVLFRESWTFEVDAHGDVEKAAKLIGGIPAHLQVPNSPWRHVVVKCDGCGQFHEDDDYGVPRTWSTPAEARRDLADDYEWTTDGTLDHCERCQPLLAQGPDTSRAPGPGQLRLLDGGRG